MRDPEEKYAYVSCARGGLISSVSFETTSTLNAAPRKGGGKRRKIQEFSRSSRKRHLNRLNEIDQDTLESRGERVISMGLTYPEEYPEKPEVCKDHLKALRKRIERKFGKFAAFWRLGVQQRGAWHFHLLLFVPPSFGPVEELRPFVASSWYEVCGKTSEDHLKAGTRVEELKNWKRVLSYAACYLAKTEQFPVVEGLGRIWGVWREDLLPIHWEPPARVSEEDGYRIRRILRRHADLPSTSSLRRLTVFIRHENMVRLLAFLGYPQE